MEKNLVFCLDVLMGLFDLEIKVHFSLKYHVNNMEHQIVNDNELKGFRHSCN